MITSIHTLIYSDDAKAMRSFLRDVLDWKYVAEVGKWSELLSTQSEFLNRNYPTVDVRK